MGGDVGPGVDDQLEAAADLPFASEQPTTHPPRPAERGQGTTPPRIGGRQFGDLRFESGDQPIDLTAIGAKVQFTEPGFQNAKSCGVRRRFRLGPVITEYALPTGNRFGFGIESIDRHLDPLFSPSGEI